MVERPHTRPYGLGPIVELQLLHPAFPPVPWRTTARLLAII
jgi:hypothetical protein